MNMVRHLQLREVKMREKVQTSIIANVIGLDLISSSWAAYSG